MEPMGSRVDPRLIPKRPNFAIERKLWKAGVSHIAGLDEAGRGALAGPIFAAAAVFASNGKAFRQLKGVRDSKELSAGEREHWRTKVEQKSLAHAVGQACADEIDQWGIIFATRLAMQRALKQISLKLEHLLVDALVLPENPLPQTTLLKGDQRSFSIAAASILAKTARDEAMLELAAAHPGYGLARHKGYGTLEHRRKLAQLGPCAAHRKSFDWRDPSLGEGKLVEAA